MPHLALFNNSWKLQGSRRFCHPVVPLHLNITILCNASSDCLWNDCCYLVWGKSAVYGPGSSSITSILGVELMKISRTTSLILFYSQNMNIIGFVIFSFSMMVQTLLSYCTSLYKCVRYVLWQYMHYHGGRYVWIVFFCRAHIVFSSS